MVSDGGWEGVWVGAGAVVVRGGSGLGEGLYFTGDSFSRKSRSSGVSSLRGSLLSAGGGLEEVNHPMTELVRLSTT